MTSSRRLIVNADDLGLQTARDNAILTLHRAGAISSATLVVNGATAAEAAARAVAQGLPLGLHLNLGDGPALTGAGSLTDREGRLLGKAGLRSALDKGLIAPRVLEAEIGAQLARFRQLVGGDPTHVDGHHHCHVAAPVAAALVRSLPAPTAIRLPLLDDGVEPLAAVAARFADDPPTLAFHQRVQQEAAAAADVFRHAGFRLPAGFFGIALMGRAMTPAALLGSLQRLPNGTAGIHELMCHPGYPSPYGDAFAASAERQQEFDTLLAVFSRRPAGLTLTDFTALNA